MFNVLFSGDSPSYILWAETWEWKESRISFFPSLAIMAHKSPWEFSNCWSKSIKGWGTEKEAYASSVFQFLPDSLSSLSSSGNAESFSLFHHCHSPASSFTFSSLLSVLPGQTPVCDDSTTRPWLLCLHTDRWMFQEERNADRQPNFPLNKSPQTPRGHPALPDNSIGFVL